VLLGVPGAATLAQTDPLWGVVADSNNNVYTTDITRHQILKITPAGFVTVVAATGNSGNVMAGDGGPATAAGLDLRRFLALDELHQRLYVTDRYADPLVGEFVGAVRYVDLVTGIIHLFAGTGPVGAPTWGDGGPATSVRFPGAVHGVAIGADGSVYIQGAGGSAGLIQKVDYATGIIHGYVAGTACGGNPSTISLLTAGDEMLAMDGSDNLYFFGQLCAGGGIRLLQVTPAKVVSVVAGGGASNASGIAATASIVSCPHFLTRDSSGSLYFTDYCDNFARKVSGGTITTIAGVAGPGGTTPEYSSVAATLLSYPQGLAVLPNGHTVIAQGGTRGLRFLW
jgi:hypothetical protein